MLPIFQVLLVFFLISVPARLTSAADIEKRPDQLKTLIDRIVVAQGGEKAIENTKSIYAAGDIDAFMKMDRGSYVLYFKRPGKLRVETKYERSSELRILNNGVGYRGTDGDPPKEVKDQRLQAMVYHYNHIDLLYGLMHGQYSVTIDDKDVLSGKIVTVLHLSDKGSPPMDVHIDPATFYIVKVTGYFLVGGNRLTTLSSEFSDFQKVGDVILPARILSTAGGNRIAETVIKTYVLNPEIPDSTFEP